MQISNPIHLERYDDFNNKHSNILSSISIQIEACDLTHIPEIVRQRFGPLLEVNPFDDSPYQIFPIEDVVYIIENITVIKSAQLSDKERDALIAHEIGHITFYENGLSLDKDLEEDCADDYSSKLGYKEDLINALRKLSNCPTCSCNKNKMIQRANRL